MKNRKIRPSMWWYILSAVILTIGALCTLTGFMYLFVSTVKNTQQIIVPGVHRLMLPASGKYIIFYEYRSVVGGKVFSTNEDLISLLDCFVQTQNGKQIVVSSIPPYEKYNLGERIKAYSAFKFKIDKPGMYILTAEYDNKKESPQIVLGVRRTLHQIIFVPALFLMLFATISILISAGIFWTTFFKRRRAKKQIYRTILR